MRDIIGALILCLASTAFAHMPDRPDLNDWFGRLSSKHGGLCCSFADGVAISTDEWDTKDGHYRVFLEGKWWVIPDENVVQEPNRYGEAVVWPTYYWRRGDNKSEISGIRCFMPGAGT